MKVKVERDVNLERLLIELDKRSQCNSNGMAGYDVNVEKQLLRDAHDVIQQFIDNQNDDNMGTEQWVNDLHEKLSMAPKIR